MTIPAWFANMTGAQAFAQNPANGFQPTLGDAFQGIGHSMMEHYRRGEGMGVPKPSGTPMSAPQNIPAPLAQPPARVQMAPPQITPFQTGTVADILAQLNSIGPVGR